MGKYSLEKAVTRVIENIRATGKADEIVRTFDVERFMVRYKVLRDIQANDPDLFSQTALEILHACDDRQSFPVTYETWGGERETIEIPAWTREEALSIFEREHPGRVLETVGQGLTDDGKEEKNPEAIKKAPNTSSMGKALKDINGGLERADSLLNLDVRGVLSPKLYGRACPAPNRGS